MKVQATLQPQNKPCTITNCREIDQEEETFFYDIELTEDGETHNITVREYRIEL